ncbi:monovalent cation/H(+) antiporter subunit G [Thermobifida halotolerans]|uniref:monovalent cation/H(+) antiporter subunit G n=1 Tax=Thermobifida halotolerans TaxID=483545 RepID=UPI000A786BA0|nr:monovalent cation/H(+) antiporter subunit G [Thermobifida halotolerans]
MNALGAVVDVLAAVALLAGGALALLAGLGLVRLPDVASRLQAATKPQVLGLALICLGVAPLIDRNDVLALALVVLFQFSTAPIVAQLVGRSAYRSGTVRDSLVADELRDRER